MKIIALDIATRTGIAIGRPGEVPKLSTEHLGKTQRERFAQALAMTIRLIRKHKPGLIVLETPRASGGAPASVTETLMGVRACVLAGCQLEGVRVTEEAVQTIRKHFIGKGNLPREDAKLATLRRCKLLGWKARDDNQADAAALWDLTCAKHSTKFSPPPKGLFDAR